MCIHTSPSSYKMRDIEDRLRSRYDVQRRHRMLSLIDGKEEAGVLVDFSDHEKLGQALADLRRWHPNCDVSHGMRDYMNEWGSYESADRYARISAHDKNPNFDGSNMFDAELVKLFKNYGYL